MRIAVVHSFYSSRQPSGENRVVEDEVAVLRKGGHSVELFSADTDSMESQPLYSVRSALRVATGLGRNPLGDLKAFEPDVVLVHNLFPNLGDRWLAEVDVPVVATLHNFRTICANGMLFRDGAVCDLCAGGNSAHSLRFGCYRGSRIATAPLAVANWGGAAKDRLLRRADLIRVLNPELRRRLIAGGLPRERIVDWANFLPDHLDPGKPPEGLRNGFLFVGRLSPEKGIVPLLRSWPADVALTVIGEGPQRSEVDRAAQGKNVTIKGPASRQEVIRAMRCAEWSVFPSQCYEGSAAPLTYIEALASGLPILATRPTSLAETVLADRTGLAFDSIDHLAGAVSGPLNRRPVNPRAVFEAAYTEAAYLGHTQALLASVGTTQQRR